MSEKFWCLSQLFARPEAQAKGIGQALLAKTLMQAERNGAANRALITFASNIASTGLYLKNGLYPREPLYEMAAPAQAVAHNLADGGYDSTPIAPWPEPDDWTRPIDQALLGFPRGFHHQFLLGGFAARAIRIERSGHIAGYAYISAQGHVGPLAIAPGADHLRLQHRVDRPLPQQRPLSARAALPHGRAGAGRRAQPCRRGI